MLFIYLRAIIERATRRHLTECDMLDNHTTNTVGDFEKIYDQIHVLGTDSSNVS